jgi:hypothetical protein
MTDPLSQFGLLVQLASAAIFHGIRAKRSQVQDPAHAVLKTKEKKILRPAPNPRYGLK